MAIRILRKKKSKKTKIRKDAEDQENRQSKRLLACKTKIIIPLNQKTIVTLQSGQNISKPGIHTLHQYKTQS